MMVELNVATPQELNLARCLVSGSWSEVLVAVLYARTGWKTIAEYIEEIEGK